MKKTIPLAAHSKTWVCGRSLGGVVDSNPTGGTDVCCECCVLSGLLLCVGLITRPEDGCDLSESDCDAAIKRRPWSTEGSSAMKKNAYRKLGRLFIYNYTNQYLIYVYKNGYYSHINNWICQSPRRELLDQYPHAYQRLSL
jgi:hypothetical protein